VVLQLLDGLMVPPLGTGNIRFVRYYSLEEHVILIPELLSFISLMTCDHAVLLQKCNFSAEKLCENVIT